MRHNTLYLALLSIFTSSSLHAALLNIPNTPLFSLQETPANVLFVMDDSGSMDWEIMARPHYPACNYNPDLTYTGCDSTLYSDGDFHFSQKLTSGGKHFDTVSLDYLFNLNDVYAVYGYNSTMDYPQIVNEDWRVYDSDFNGMAYNPDVTYSPWAGPCSGTGSSSYVSCTNATFTNAHSYPHQSHADYSTTVNLANVTYNSAQFIHSYAVGIDDKKFTGTTPNRSNIAAGSNGMVDPWDTHALIQFVNSGAISITVRATSLTTALQSVTNTNTLSSGSNCYNALGTQSLVQQIIAGTLTPSSTGGTGCRTVAQAQQNYANWFQYYRRRALASKAAVSYIISQFPTLYYGLSYINDGNSIANKLPASGANLINSNNDLLSSYYQDIQQAVGTPLITALDTAGKYYSGLLGTSPIQTSCQRNFSIMMTDGYWNDSNLQRPKRGDVDGDGYGVSYSSLSDIAYYFYKNDLSSTLADNIRPTKNDPNTKQHMVTMGIALGASSNLTSGTDGWPTPALQVNSDWGNPECSDDCQAKINDLWHAAFNSKGQFFTAQNFSDLQAGLSSSLQGIITAMLGASSSSTSNSSMLQNNSNIYQAKFKGDTWAGDLQSYSIDSNGNISSTPTWSGAAKIDATTPTNRVIFTYGNKKGVPFRWPANYLLPGTNEIPLAQTSLLVSGLTGVLQTVGGDMVNYIRGDRSKELAKGGTYRNRSSAMGDVIHSGAVYVGPPSALYTDAFYVAFKAANVNRTPMVFVGANDGMLHGFNANTGAEMFAYVPGQSAIWNNLQLLTKDPYSHRYFVDETPVVADYLRTSDNTYHTVLASGLGLGGQGIFALDVTTGSFTETAANAAATVLWEFSDANDIDMGYTFGTPQIVRMYNKKWAVIFGNGYNNKATTAPSGKTDSKVSTTGQAVLYILFIEGGTDGTWTVNTDYIKIPLGATGGNNGLSQPVAVDINGDYTADYIYAGDLNGDLWKVKVTDVTPTNWKLAANISKLYSAGTTPGNGSQPIIQAPVVGTHPNGLSQGLLVYFGTGKYMEASDATTTGQTTQTMYAIWDKNGTTATTLSGTTTLLQQTLLGSVGGYRAVSNNSIDWTTKNGWYLNLDTAEKVISKPILRNGRIIFTTIVPTTTTAASGCSASDATSWLMELDAKNGGRLNIPPFDANGDGVFDSNDYIQFTQTTGGTTTTVKAPPAGVQSTVGVTAAPTIIATPSNKSELKVLSGTGGISSITENPGQSVRGRQTWQELN